MKTIQAIALSAAAISILSLAACSSSPDPIMPTPAPIFTPNDAGTYTPSK